MSQVEFELFNSKFLTLTPIEQTKALNKILGGSSMGLFYSNLFKGANSFTNEDRVVISIKISRDELLKYAQLDEIYIGFENNPNHIEINIFNEDFIRSIAINNRYQIVNSTDVNSAP